MTNPLFDLDSYPRYQTPKVADKEEIKVGDRVRFFDFGSDPVNNRQLEGEEACYTEGILIGFVALPINGCENYAIQCDTDYGAGERRTFETVGKYTREGSIVYGPVNGTRYLSRGAYNNAERIPHNEEVRITVS